MMGATIAIVFGSWVAATALWFYSRRYIGELALIGAQKRIVRLSVMDFWGNREVRSMRIANSSMCSGMIQIFEPKHFN